jgi:hypothetical protein
MAHTHTKQSIETSEYGTRVPTTTCAGTSAEEMPRDWEPGQEDPEERALALIAALSHFDRGDGCLGIIVRQAIKDNPSADADDIREICIEAEADAAVERAREEA